MTCKEICHRYKTGKNNDGSRYGNGKKRCNICEIFIECDGNFCPCCGNKLRTKPRSRKLRERNE